MRMSCAVLTCRALTGAALCLLSACASAPPVLEGAPAAAASLRSWTVQGRIALRQGAQGWHADLYWRQDGERYHIRLSGPLGQGGAEIEGDAQGVRMTLADHTQVTAPDPETLLAQHLGWRLPVAGLRYWVRGMPAPGGAQQLERDSAGRLHHLEQEGWRINYPAYTPQHLPTKLDLSRDDVHVRLIIDRWEDLAP